MRVLLTRPEGRNEQLAEALRALGLEVVCEPLIAVEPVGDERVDVDGYDWVVVTSVVGANELRRRMRGRPKRVTPRVKVCWTIGRPTESGEQCALSHALSVFGASAPPPGAIRSRSSPEFE